MYLQNTVKKLLHRNNNYRKIVMITYSYINTYCKIKTAYSNQ